MLPAERSREGHSRAHAVHTPSQSTWWGPTATVTITVLAVSLLLLSARWGIVSLSAVVVVAVAWFVVRYRGEGRRSFPLIIATTVGLSIALPSSFVFATSSPASHIWLIPLLLAGLAGWRLAVVIGNGEQRLVEFMVWVFVYVFFGLAPMVQLRVGIDPPTTPFIDHTLDFRALMVVTLGTCAFALGLLAARRLAASEEAGESAPRVRSNRVTILAWFGLACAAFFILRVGLTPLLSSRVDLDQAAAAVWSNPTTLAIISALSIMPLLVAFVALQIEKTETRDRGWLRARLLPWIIGTVLLLVANPISNARYTSGTVYLAVLASLGLVSTRPRFRLVCIGFVVSLVLVFPLADAFRYSANAEIKESNPVLALTTGDFDAYDQVVNTVHYVDVRGITYGYQALGPLVFWIPRTAWPNKPVDTGILLANFRGYTFTNLSATLWTELFINGGWVVLLLGLFVFGILVRRWDESISRRLRAAKTPGLLASILPFYLLILLRGSLLQAMAALAVIAVSAAVVRGRHYAAAATPGVP